MQRKIEGSCQKVSVTAVAEALNLMKARKATASKGVTFVLLKTCRNNRVEKLAKVADDLLHEKVMLASWRSDLIQTYKRKWKDHDEIIRFSF